MIGKGKNTLLEVVEYNQPIKELLIEGWEATLEKQKFYKVTIFRVVTGSFWARKYSPAILFIQHSTKEKRLMYVTLNNQLSVIVQDIDQIESILNQELLGRLLSESKQIPMKKAKSLRLRSSFGYTQLHLSFENPESILELAFYSSLQLETWHQLISKVWAGLKQSPPLENALIDQIHHQDYQKHNYKNLFGSRLQGSSVQSMESDDGEISSSDREVYKILQENKRLKREQSQAEMKYQSLMCEYERIKRQNGNYKQALSEKSKVCLNLKEELERKEAETVENDVLTKENSQGGTQTDEMKGQVYDVILKSSQMAVDQERGQRVDVSFENREILNSKEAYLSKEERSRKVEKLQEKILALERTNYLHIFQGDVLEACLKEKMYLRQELEQYCHRRVKATRLLYRHDPLNKTNCHRYIDNHPHLLVLVRLTNGHLAAAYSEHAMNPDVQAFGGGLLVAINQQKSFKLMAGKRSVTYDAFFIIFGNSELRLKTGQLRFFTNMGIGNGFYSCEGCKHTTMTGDTPRDTQASTFEFFQVLFADKEDELKAE